MNYSLDKLLATIVDGNQVNYLFFWGHTQKRKSVDKSCFSQWFPSVFTVGGVLYRTAEHWMMAQKALLFEDEEIYKEIIASTSADEAKKLGRKVKNFDPKIWDDHKYSIVVSGNFHKFSKHEELAFFLRNTMDRVIVEASPYDKVWGIGMTSDHKNAEYPERWNGKNLLGFALMEVRDMLLQ